MASSLTPSRGAPGDEPESPLLGRLPCPAPRVALYGPAHPGRADLENYVAARFREAYGAEVRHFLPLLLGMHCLGQVSAVTGLRPAAAGELFLEQYLNEGAESALRTLTGEAVERRHLMEVGNLAAARRGASQFMFPITAALLHRAGYEWMIFTATPALLNSLARLAWPVLRLCEADAARLRRCAREDWGSYYDSAPVVAAGRLTDAMQVIEDRPVFKGLLRHYEPCLASLSAELTERAHGL